MTDGDAINRFLALNVMKWKLCDAQQYPWYERPKGAPIYVTHWKPYTEWPDCEPLLDQIERDQWWWNWNAHEDGYTFAMRKIGGSGNSWLHFGKADTRTAALCRAIATAYRFKEEVNR